MNRVNRSRFSQLRQQYELQKMMAAYIGAEKKIMMDPGLTGFTDAKTIIDSMQFKSYHQDENGDIIETFEPMSPEEFFNKDVDGFGNLRANADEARQKQLLLEQAKSIREMIDRAVIEERYEDCAELERTLDIIKKKYERLD